MALGKRKYFDVVLLCLTLLFYVLFLVESRNPLIVDDVHPEAFCNTTIQKADVLYIIPFYNGKWIDNDENWCHQIKNLNKIIGLHGIRHTYHEFDHTINESELDRAVTAVGNCVGNKSLFFRPPYNLISKENEEKIKRLNMTIYKERYFTHPYCHCHPQSYMKLLNWILLC